MNFSSIKSAIKQRLLYASPSKPYNFLIHKVHQTPDVELASKVFLSDYFKGVLVPQEIDINQFKKVVVIAPHQDDEAIGCGGLLCALAHKNIQIDLVFVTDGRPTTADWRENVATRSQEAHQAAALLQANVYELNVNNVTLETNQEQFDQLKSIVSNDYDAIFTVWPLDYPPKHRYVNALLNQALKNVAADLQVFCYAVHSALLPNVFFDYTEIFEEKQKLIEVYKSQLAYQNYTHISAGLDSWNSRQIPRSNEKRYVELYTQIPLKEWKKIMKLYDHNLDQTFRGHENCIKSYKKLQKLV